MSSSKVDAIWDDVERYLARAQPRVQKRWIEKEGRVHATLASGNLDAFRIINREASPSFLDATTKDATGKEVWAAVGTALQSADGSEKWWPTTMTVGNSLDFLAVDVGGRLALIEAKHHSATGMIAKVAAQVGSYARLYSYLLQDDQQGALQLIDEMLKQRVQLGLARNGVLYLMQPVRIVDFPPRADPGYWAGTGPYADVGIRPSCGASRWQPIISAIAVIAAHSESC